MRAKMEVAGGVAELILMVEGDNAGRLFAGDHIWPSALDVSALARIGVQDAMPERTRRGEEFLTGAVCAYFGADQEIYMWSSTMNDGTGWTCLYGKKAGEVSRGLRTENLVGLGKAVVQPIAND